MGQTNGLLLALLVGLTLATGCTDAKRAKLGGYGSKHRVTLYSGGKAVASWTSSGKVRSEENSDGYYFNDAETGNLIEVAGNVVIERLD